MKSCNWSVLHCYVWLSLQKCPHFTVYHSSSWWNFVRKIAMFMIVLWMLIMQYIYEKNQLVCFTCFYLVPNFQFWHFYWFTIFHLNYGFRGKATLGLKRREPLQVFLDPCLDRSTVVQASEIPMCLQQYVELYQCVSGVLFVGTEE